MYQYWCYCCNGRHSVVDVFGDSVVLASENWHKGSSVFWSGIWRWMIKAWGQTTGWGHCFVFSSLLWHCQLGSMMDIWPIKSPCAIDPQRWSSKTSGTRKLNGDWRTGVRLEKRPINRGCCCCWSLVWYCQPLRCIFTVRMSARTSQKPHVQTSRNFLYIFTVAVDRSSSDDRAIHYVVTILWMTFPHNGANGAESRKLFNEFARWQHRGKVWCPRLSYGL